MERLLVILRLGTEKWLLVTWREPVSVQSGYNINKHILFIVHTLLLRVCLNGIVWVSTACSCGREWRWMVILDKHVHMQQQNRI